MKNYNNKGFSLIELSIVLIIIGLLVAGVTAGNALIKTAEIRAVAREFEEHKTALSTFRSTYDVLPGDISDQSLATSLGTPNANIGNNDGRIDYCGTTACVAPFSNEGLEAWRQLSRANMVSGQYTGSNGTNGTNAVIQDNTPQSKLSGAGYYIDYDQFNTTQGNANLVVLGSADNTGPNDTAAMTTIDARNLDRKYDDGIPRTGDIWGDESLHGATTTCINAGTYNIAATTAKDKQCIIAYILFR